MSNAIGSSRESNPPRRICNLHAVPLGHVADKKDQDHVAGKKLPLTPPGIYLPAVKSLFFVEMKAILFCKTKHIHLLVFCETDTARNYF